MKALGPPDHPLDDPDGVVAGPGGSKQTGSDVLKYAAGRWWIHDIDYG